MSLTIFGRFLTRLRFSQKRFEEGSSEASRESQSETRSLLVLEEVFLVQCSLMRRFDIIEIVIPLLMDER